MARIFRHPVVPLLLAAVVILSLLRGGPDNPLDERLSLSLIRSAEDLPALFQAAIAFTWLGDGARLIPMAALIIVVLLALKRWKLATLLAVSIIVERILVHALKLWFERPRPESPFEAWMPSSFAWPSGHAGNSLTTAMLVALLVVPARWRSAAVTVALAFTFAVGMSRTLLGVHWPSDVVGGWAFGLIAVWLTLRIGEASGAIEPQHQVVGGHRPSIGESEAA
jgi:membrane-associated phospholipid phosphatase